MKVVEVFADVGCPFAHVGLQRFCSYRQQHGKTEPILRVRAWPLELVNGKALDGRSLAPKVQALRAGVAVDLFSGFDEHRFPATTLPAMAAEAAAYQQSLEVGEQFSLSVRHALFEQGLNVSDEDILRDLCQMNSVPPVSKTDRRAVRDDFAEGERRGVAGSPHFFTAEGDFFCPSLTIEHHDNSYEVSFDRVAFERFVVAAFN